MIRPVWRSWLNLLYPAHCLLCSAPLDPHGSFTTLCDACRQRLHQHQPPFCAGCGRPLPYATAAGTVRLSAERCPDCLRQRRSTDRVWAAYPYNDTLQHCIHLAKFQGKTHLLNDLGTLMVQFAQDHHLADTIDVVTAVPLHPVRLRERGFNQSERLARILGQRLSRPVVRPLTRMRHTPPQSRQGKQARLASVRRAFVVRQAELIAERTVLLVDDVVTTGATLDACGRALLDSGARRVIGFVLAHG